jgi:hypothetical protein
MCEGKTCSHRRAFTTMKGKLSWLMATFTWKEQAQYQQRGRPKKEATPNQTVWYLVSTLKVDQHEVEAVARQKAAFIVATNILNAQRLSSEQVLSTYQVGMQLQLCQPTHHRERISCAFM